MGEDMIKSSEDKLAEAEKISKDFIKKKFNIEDAKLLDDLTKVLLQTHSSKKGRE